VPIGTPILLKERTLETLSGDSEIQGYARSYQEQPRTMADEQADAALNAASTESAAAAATAAANEAAAAQAAATTTEEGADLTVTGQATDELPSVYGKRATFSSPVEKEKSFIGGLLGSIADNALTAAIHGTSIKNAVINTAVGGITQGIVSAVRTPVRGARTQPGAEQETSTASTAERPPVTPNNQGGSV
jgi:hypothetical protein